jgi:four helix bundle protein
LLYRIAMELLHEKHKVHQRAVEFADRIYRFADALPKREEALADQFKRAAMSMTLISVEDHGVWHPDERREFFLVTRGSAFECLPLLDLCRQRKLIEDPVYDDFNTEVEVIARMMTKLIQSVDQ